MSDVYVEETLAVVFAVLCLFFPLASVIISTVCLRAEVLETKGVKGELCRKVLEKTWLDMQQFSLDPGVWSTKLSLLLLASSYAWSQEVGARHYVLSSSLGSHSFNMHASAKFLKAIALWPKAFSEHLWVCSWRKFIQFLGMSP